MVRLKLFQKFHTTERVMSFCVYIHFCVLHGHMKISILSFLQFPYLASRRTSCQAMQRQRLMLRVRSQGTVRLEGPKWRLGWDSALKASTGSKRCKPIPSPTKKKNKNKNLSSHISTKTPHVFCMGFLYPFSILIFHRFVVTCFWILWIHPPKVQSQGDCKGCALQGCD